MDVIDDTYFETAELFIPNNKDLNAQPEGSPTAQTNLTAIRKKYERELLLNALGVTLYAQLVVALDDLGAADPKWDKLVTGSTYVIDGKTYIWDGLRGFLKQSLVAFYAYSQYLVFDELTYATVGVVKNQSDTAVTADSTAKYVRSFGSFLEQYQGDLYQFRRNYSSMYSGKGYGNTCSAGKDYLGYLDSIELYKQFTRNVQASLWQYLNDSNELDPTAFPDFQFKIYAPYNRFGI
jgi:hypothetical protein